MLVACGTTGDKSSDGTATTSTSTSADAAKEIQGPKDPGVDNADAVQIKKPTKKTNQRLAKLEPARALELPPDLVSSSNDTVVGNAEAVPEARVLPEIVGARIVKQDGDMWLDIDTNVESAWNTIDEYWASIGITLVDYNPEAGVMETEWISKEIEVSEGDSAVKTIFKGLYQGVTGRFTSYDKYRIRFERVSPNKTSMYVSHRLKEKQGIERGRQVTEFVWVEVTPDPEKIADFLQHIILVFDETASV